RVAAPVVTLSDTPRDARTQPRAFDAEGVPKRQLALLEDGVARAVVHDPRSAATAGGGARPTGHAPAPGGTSYGAAPRNPVPGGRAVGGARLRRAVDGRLRPRGGDLQAAAVPLLPEQAKALRGGAGAGGRGAPGARDHRSGAGRRRAARRGARCVSGMDRGEP